MIFSTVAEIWEHGIIDQPRSPSIDIQIHVLKFTTLCTAEPQYHFYIYRGLADIQGYQIKKVW